MGLVLLIPFFLIRFGLLYALDKDAVIRAARFAPLLPNERLGYWIYQLSNIAIFIYMFFLKLRFSPRWMFAVSAIIYVFGCVMLIVSIINFAHPSGSGINQNGIYKLSRNPMYVAYFVLFIGCVLMTQSWILLALVMVFQISAHWIIRSEERWCIQSFGDEYESYMKRVRRYI